MQSSQRDYHSRVEGPHHTVSEVHTTPKPGPIVCSRCSALGPYFASVVSGNTLSYLFICVAYWKLHLFETCAITQALVSSILSACSTHTHRHRPLLLCLPV